MQILIELNSSLTIPIFEGAALASISGSELSDARIIRITLDVPTRESCTVHHSFSEPDTSTAVDCMANSTSG